MTDSSWSPPSFSIAMQFTPGLICRRAAGKVSGLAQDVFVSLKNNKKMHFRQLLKLVHWFVPCHQKPLVAEKKLLGEFRDPSNIQYAVMVRTSQCGRSWDAKNAATGRGLFGNPIAGAAAMWPWESKLPEVGIWCPYNYGEIYPYIAEAALPSTKKIPWFIIARHRDDDSPKCHRRPWLKRRLFETRCFRFGFLQRHGWHGDDIRTSLMLSYGIHITVQNVKNRHSITCLYWWLNGEWWLIIVHDSSPSSQVWISSYFTIESIVVDASSSLNWWIINGEWRCMVVNLFLTVSSNFREMGHP